MKYYQEEETTKVRIITEDGEITLEPGVYITPKALDKLIQKEKGEDAITFGTLRKQIQNYGLGQVLKTNRLLSMREAYKIIGLVGSRKKK